MKAKVQPVTTGMWLFALALSTPILLVPFSRAFIAPLGVLAVIGLVMLVGLLRHRGTFNSEDKALQVLPRVFLFIWLPMLISLIDAEYPKQVLKAVQLYPLYGLMALAVVVLLRATPVIKQTAIIMSWIVGVWAFDGVAQTLLGIDMFNIPLMRENVAEIRANAFFSHPNKYGFYMGMMAAIPLFTMYLCGVNRLTHILVSAMLLAAVLMGGSRGGWIMFGVAFLPYLYLIYIKPAKRPIVQMLMLPILLGATLALVFQLSPSMQNRWHQSMQAKTLDYAAVNVASSGRLDIYIAAWRMGAAHPINGVGINSFDKTSHQYLPQNSTWPKDLFPPHPHQVMLEIWSGAGIIGILGFMLAWLAMWRLWKQALPEQRKRALPVLMPLFVLWWPLNTHRGFYASELAILSLFFVALSIAALTSRSDYQ
jgi:O-antigen ligase